MWFIQPFDNTIERKIKKFKSDKPLIKNYKAFIEELKVVDDPRTLGDLKHGKFRHCYGIHLTKSHSLIYYVDFQQNTVFLIDLDDNKNLYGRDNKA
ncbi:MAG: hypothetical protein LV477_11640 [Candidatus Nitrosotalea sp.]|nr:hypothetical protein [Candidatus Nitrosotalea sp.]